MSPTPEDYAKRKSRTHADDIISGHALTVGMLVKTWRKTKTIWEVTHCYVDGRNRTIVHLRSLSSNRRLTHRISYFGDKLYYLPQAKEIAVTKTTRPPPPTRLASIYLIVSCNQLRPGDRIKINPFTPVVWTVISCQKESGQVKAVSSGNYRKTFSRKEYFMLDNA
jgi:hypothetical protein